VLVILDGLTKNFVPNFGRFGVVWIKKIIEGEVRIQSVPSHRKLCLPRRVTFWSGLL
jgi:hypothetical protein